MRKFLKITAAIILALIVVYLAGPKPPKPSLSASDIVLPPDISGLEQQIAEEESSTRGLKPGNEARIVWADTSKKEKTRYSILYLHGFSASQAEGEPVHRNLARNIGANLYLSRLSEHGIDRGDSTMIFLNADEYLASAERALAIAGMLGEEVIVIGTSTGGAMALYLA